MYVASEKNVTAINTVESFHAVQESLEDTFTQHRRQKTDGSFISIVLFPFQKPPNELPQLAARPVSYFLISTVFGGIEDICFVGIGIITLSIIGAFIGGRCVSISVTDKPYGTGIAGKDVKNILFCGAGQNFRHKTQ